MITLQTKSRTTKPSLTPNPTVNPIQTHVSNPTSTSLPTLHEPPTPSLALTLTRAEPGVERPSRDAAARTRWPVQIQTAHTVHFQSWGAD